MNELIRLNVISLIIRERSVHIMSGREENGIVETGFPFIDAFNPLEQQENQQKDTQINNLSISIQRLVIFFKSFKFT